MSKSERETVKAIRSLTDMTWKVALGIGSLEKPKNRTPENIQACIDALDKLSKLLEKLKAALLTREQ